MKCKRMQQKLVLNDGWTYTRDFTVLDYFMVKRSGAALHPSALPYHPHASLNQMLHLFWLIIKTVTLNSWTHFVSGDNSNTHTPSHWLYEQGSHFSAMTKFHDFSMIFPRFFANFPVLFSLFNVASVNLGFPHFVSHCTAGRKILKLCWEKSSQKFQCIS